ncbi:MAG TPA: hypothetical protein VJ697_08715 [Nitrososphaeraceae archaeon]|nr:hypothetical protein [Nitrososphaeraceae archaeon]
MNNTQSCIISVFLPNILFPLITIHYISLENIRWIDRIDPKDPYFLQYPSLNDRKIIEVDNQSNSNFFFKFSSIDNNNSFDHNYDFNIVHNENNSSIL